MAIVLLGETSCAICAKVIERGDEAVLFPDVVLNEQDPLYALSDAACHAACVNADARGRAVLAASDMHVRNTGPGQRACAVCGGEILDPNDYLLIPWLGDSLTEPLGRFNYTHLHTSHIRDWKQADAFLAVAKGAIGAGRWGGPALSKLIADIEAARGAAAPAER
jgi:hypothetical protein